MKLIQLLMLFKKREAQAYLVGEGTVGLIACGQNGLVATDKTRTTRNRRGKVFLFH